MAGSSLTGTRDVCSVSIYSCFDSCVQPQRTQDMCWFNAGPASQTLIQHQSSTESIWCTPYMGRMFIDMFVAIKVVNLLADCPLRPGRYGFRFLSMYWYREAAVPYSTQDENYWHQLFSLRRCRWLRVVVSQAWFVEVCLSWPAS